MSLSNPTTNTNPATKYIKWKGGEGRFAYYDKENKEEVLMPKKFYVIPLDTCTTITGWSDSDQSGIWSNEVKHFTEPLTVKTKVAVRAKGPYSEIKDKVATFGGKYTKSMYAALVTKNEVELVNLQFAGSALSAFIEARIGDEGYTLELSTNPEQQKKGATKYYTPLITKHETEKEVIEKAIKLDSEVLQPYLKTYFNNNAETNEITETVNKSEQQAETLKEIMPKKQSTGDLPEVSKEDLEVKMPF